MPLTSALEFKSAIPRPILPDRSLGSSNIATRLRRIAYVCRSRSPKYFGPSWSWGRCTGIVGAQVEFREIARSVDADGMRGGLVESARRLRLKNILILPRCEIRRDAS